MTEFDWSNAPTICELNGYRWVLGPVPEEEMDWYESGEWCEAVGGVLPPREVLLLASMNPDISVFFTKDSYWSSSDQSRTQAWSQCFREGRWAHQDGSCKKYAYVSARAVRAIKLGELNDNR